VILGMGTVTFWVFFLVDGAGGCSLVRWGRVEGKYVCRERREREEYRLERDFQTFVCSYVMSWDHDPGQGTMWGKLYQAVKLSVGDSRPY
jgi:hypothetical protein